MNRIREGSLVAPRLVKTKQAAEYLAISEWKIRNLVQQGLLPYICEEAAVAHGALIFETLTLTLSEVVECFLAKHRPEFQSACCRIPHSKIPGFPFRNTNRLLALAAEAFPS